MHHDRNTSPQSPLLHFRSYDVRPDVMVKKPGRYMLDLPPAGSTRQLRMNGIIGQQLRLRRVVSATACIGMAVFRAGEDGPYRKARPQTANDAVPL